MTGLTGSELGVNGGERVEGQEYVRLQKPDVPLSPVGISPFGRGQDLRPDDVPTDRRTPADHVDARVPGVRERRLPQERGRRRIDARLRSGYRQVVADRNSQAWIASSDTTSVSPPPARWAGRAASVEVTKTPPAVRLSQASIRERRPLDRRLRSHGEFDTELARTSDAAHLPWVVAGAEPASQATTAIVAAGVSHRFADPAADAAPPRLAEGVELLGEYQGAGFTFPVYLARRPDGQVVQLSHLLFLALGAIDGRRGPTELAAEVSAAAGRGLSDQGVQYLLGKLAPLGLLDSNAPAGHLEDPLLGLRLRRTLVPARVVNRLSGVLQGLFWPPVVVIALLNLVIAGTWLIMSGSVRSVVAEPWQVLLVLALLLASRLFHECGHAAGCTYGGARPGIIGFGIYLVWPAFFTNVTDAYRLDRRGRLRTDLGGVYFNLLFVLVLSATYFATAVPAFVVAMLFTQLEMLQQFLPIVRLDGYYILGDLVGVPELFGRVKPILTSLISRGPTHPRVQELRPRVRVIVTLWVLITLPLLAGYLVIFMVTLPQVAGTLYNAVVSQASGLKQAVTSFQLVAIIVDVVSLATLLIAPLGTVLVLASMAQRVTQLSLRWSQGQPIRRIGIILIAVLAMAGVGTWWRVQLP
jgi:putative peptide zinc metalloprotease protein